MAKKVAKPLTKPEIIEAIAKETGSTKVAVESIYNALVALVAKETKKTCTLPGLGKFSVVQRKARTGRNPQTGEELQIAASKNPSFKPGKALKEAVNVKPAKGKKKAKSKK